MTETEKQELRIRRANMAASAICNYAEAVAVRMDHGSTGEATSDEHQFYREMQDALLALQEPVG